MTRSPAFVLLLLLPLGALAAPGGSLFEQVATRHGSTAIPYPLDALLARIAAQLAQGRDGLRVVLIPVGRSLQRHAAGDAHYFDSPRAVIAVTGEPVDPTAPLLKDRLYLGHLAATGVLEVISYHPGTGRFEFFIVDDYRAGATPQLRAANRGLCLACHQNDAPLFSRESWDETSANPIIARLLASTGRDYGGLPWRHGVDVPQAIDEATERANLLPVAQRIWAACTDADAAATAACRQRLFWRTLVSRLRGVPDTAALADDAALAPLVRHWRRAWPDGLAVPDPDIPNRQPFAATLPWQTVPTDAATLRQLADVAERFDPLALRPPRAHWPLDAAGTPSRVFHALGQFLSDTDVLALDTALRARGGTPLTQSMDCRVSPRGARRNLDCRIGAQLRMQARLEGTDLKIDRLVLDGHAVPSPRMQATATGFAPQGRRPRRADGHALAQIRVDATGASVTFIDDLAPLRQALAGLETTPPLRRANLLGPLLGALDQPAPTPVDVASPLAFTDSGARASDPALALFYRHCGLCHSGSDAFPPGFLRGDDATVHRRVAQCAPRMLRRLAMWRHPAGHREKTPMPPPASAQAEALRLSGELTAMRNRLAKDVEAGGGSLAALAAIRYAELPPCAIYPESAHGR